MKQKLNALATKWPFSKETHGLGRLKHDTNDVHPLFDREPIAIVFS